MLEITIPQTELFDEDREIFIDIKEQVLQLEHSLISISKWEAKWHKPFLTKEQRSNEESLDYIRCMTITKNVKPNVYYALTDVHFAQINAYLEDPMTATWITENQKDKVNREIVTSEVIYYWMIALDIPPEYEKWHLNRLLMLIRVCNKKNEPQKKMGKKELNARNRALNEARKRQLNTRG